MTLEEAQTIARIAGTADGGCATCVGHLMEQLNAAFPQFAWEFVANPEPRGEEPEDYDEWEAWCAWPHTIGVARPIA